MFLMLMNRKKYHLILEQYKQRCTMFSLINQGYFQLKEFYDRNPGY